ncbi:MAG: hypothetical protein QXP36_02950 [Conexivisphaerales archaeon]
MTELEYNKYKQMNKVAHTTRNRMITAMITELIGLAGFVIFLFFGLHGLNSIIASTSPIFSYTKTIIQNAHLNFSNNASITASITKLNQNPSLQNAYFLENIAASDFLFALIFTVALVITGLYLYHILADLASLIRGQPSLRSYKELKNALKEKQEMLKRLSEYGYTQKEIDWYFEVRSKMRELDYA